MTAKRLLKFLNDNPVVKPTDASVKLYLTKQELDDWKTYCKEYQEEDEIIGEEPAITDIKMRHGPLLRAGHMRLERARKAGIKNKTLEVANKMEELVERYIEAVDELHPAIRGTMLLVDPHDPVAPDYIVAHIPPGSIYIPRSWATRIGSTIGKKTSKRDKLIEFLEMAIEDRKPAPEPEAPKGGKQARNILDIVRDLKTSSPLYSKTNKESD